jgi:hypothetical protein
MNYGKLLLNGNSSIGNLGIEFPPQKKETMSPLQFTKMIAVYSEYHTKPINVLGQNAAILNVVLCKELM